jgi:N-acetylneuraminic acid mutarotase
VAYFDEEQVDYGFNEEDLWYDEEFDEWLDPNDPCYQNNCADLLMLIGTL